MVRKAPLAPSVPWPLALLTGAVGLLVLAPIGILVYQSLLTAPFFAPAKRFALEAYRYVLHDPYFLEALKNSFLIGLGMVLIAVPLGSLFAFLVTKTDLPFARLFELLLLAPIFISAIILGIGFIVAFGPSGVVSGWVESLLGHVPWTIYTLPAIAVIAGLTHVPYVYLYVASTIQNVDASLEEAARVAGARPYQVALSVTLPLVRPALVYSGALMLLLGFELFGLPLVLGDAKGIMVVTTYLYRLTAITGTSAYHLMAAVSVLIVLIAFTLVLLQRYLVGRMEGRYVAIGARGYRTERLPLGRLRYVWAFALALYLLVAVVLPVLGVVFRSLVTSWGPGVDLREVFTVGHYADVFKLPNLSRAVTNTAGETMQMTKRSGEVVIIANDGSETVLPAMPAPDEGHTWVEKGAGEMEVEVIMGQSSDGLFISSAEPLDEATRETIRSALQAAGITRKVEFMEPGMRKVFIHEDTEEGPAGEVRMIKKVQVIQDISKN